MLDFVCFCAGTQNCASEQIQQMPLYGLNKKTKLGCKPFFNLMLFLALSGLFPTLQRRNIEGSFDTEDWKRTYH